ncbi:MAG: glycosyltransferase family 9 protein [Desulfovermiculus sp.]|nr:glycosyltransferase family 9 protein [Desulfovermiculus sp.]
MPHQDYKRICLIRTSALGDTVHALGLINTLRQGYPLAHLTWVLQTLPYEMVKHQPGINQFITFNRKSGLRDWISLIGRLREQAFDLVIAPQASAKVSFLTFASRAKDKLGFDWMRSREMHWMVTNLHIPSHPMQHVQNQFIEFARFLGIQETIPSWDFVFTPQERAWQKAFFAHIPRPAVGLVIASAHAHKDWPPANYARIADFVHQKLDMEPILIGGPSPRERRIADDIRAKCRCQPLMALEKSIRRTMLQLDGCRLVVAPDTGPLHIAVALNTPTVGLYGYSNPRRCGPYRFHDLLLDAYNIDEPEDAPITRKTKPGRMDPHRTGNGHL